MVLDVLACNLATLNLMRFTDGDGIFDTATCAHAVDIAIQAQESLVDEAGFPTGAIVRNLKVFRPI